MNFFFVSFVLVFTLPQKESGKRSDEKSERSVRKSDPKVTKTGKSDRTRFAALLLRHPDVCPLLLFAASFPFPFPSSSLQSHWFPCKSLCSILFPSWCCSHCSSSLSVCFEMRAFFLRCSIWIGWCVSKIESTASNTERSELFALAEVSSSQPTISAKANSPCFSQSSPRLPKSQWVGAVEITSTVLKGRNVTKI